MIIELNEILKSYFNKYEIHIYENIIVDIDDEIDDEFVELLHNEIYNIDENNIINEIYIYDDKIIIELKEWLKW